MHTRSFPMPQDLLSRPEEDKSFQLYNRCMIHRDSAVRKENKAPCLSMVYLRVEASTGPSANSDSSDDRLLDTPWRSGQCELHTVAVSALKGPVIPA